MHAQLIKQLILEILKRLADKDKRENLMIGLLTAIGIIVVGLSLIWYIISHPISALKTVIKGEQNIAILENFKNETYVNASYYGEEISNVTPSGQTIHMLEKQ